MSELIYFNPEGGKEIIGNIIAERDSLLAENERLRAALRTARNAMDERRDYSEAWEWKYGEAWDEEDAEVRAALEEK